jgi:hypothetical protein
VNAVRTYRVNRERPRFRAAAQRRASGVADRLRTQFNGAAPVGRTQFAERRLPAAARARADIGGWEAAAPAGPVGPSARRLRIFPDYPGPQLN